MTSDSNLVFYIAHYCADASDEILIQYCVQSIQNFYPTSEIVICRSPSTYESTVYSTFRNVLIIENPLPNSFTCGCIKDYLERYKNSQKKLITLHDSIFLKGRFVDERLARRFGFIWKFANSFCNPDYLCNPQMRMYYFELIQKDPIIKLGTFAGCTGCCIFGTYSAVSEFWNFAPFEEYLEIEDKKNVLQDFERMFGMLAFKYNLVKDENSCSLCGDYFDFSPTCKKWFVGQPLDDIYKLDYKEACVKVIKQRFMKS
jgi:hypothetical protein